jgi:hypothetical protein
MPRRARDVYAHLDAQCLAVGRDTSDVRRTALVGLLLGRSWRAYEGRRRSLVHLVGGAPGAETWLEERRQFWVHVTSKDLLNVTGDYAAAGCDGLILDPR